VFERTWGRSFVSALANLGWVENQNLALEWRYSDVLVVQSTPETAVVKRITSTVPVVMVLVGDPVGSGLVDSLARPGGNITGTSLMATDTAAKRLQLLREIVPAARRVAVLGNPRNAAVARSWMETQEAASRIGMQVIAAEAETRDDVPKAFARIVRERPDAMVVILDSLMVDHRHEIVEFAAKNGVPTVYGGPMFADAGGLLVYTVDFHELWRRAANYVDRILKGAKPGDLPIEQPTKFELTVNLKSAKALGLTIPRSVLLRADHVIE
jgi:putative ABC transport system substrate-binding protein